MSANPTDPDREPDRNRGEDTTTEQQLRPSPARQSAMRVVAHTSGCGWRYIQSMGRQRLPYKVLK
jgi:hypothetical protein